MDHATSPPIGSYGFTCPKCGMNAWGTEPDMILTVIRIHETKCLPRRRRLGRHRGTK